MPAKQAEAGGGGNVPGFVTAAASALTCLLPTVAAAAAAAEPAETAGGFRPGPGPLRNAIDTALHWTATGIEVAGVAIIVAGALIATVAFLRRGPAAGWAQAYRRYRADLGRGILLGLELLVAADIICTVAATPTLQSMAVLGLIVLIRTFLSFSLEVEIEGRLPWRAAEAEAARDRDAAPREQL